MSCTGNKQWYVCTKGSFRGCCSSDPCTTGVCPDDKSGSSSNPVTSSTSSSTTSSTNSSSTTTATKPTTSFKTGSDASATAVLSSSSLPPTETITAAPESATTTGSSSSSSSGGGVSKGLIGGVVVGSVVALLLLVGILLLIYYRSRKKHGKGFMLLGWYKPQYSRGQGQQQQRAGRGGCCGSDSEKPAVEGTGDCELTQCLMRDGCMDRTQLTNINERSRFRPTHHIVSMQLLQHTIIGPKGRNPHFHFHHYP